MNAREKAFEDVKTRLEKVQEEINLTTIIVLELTNRKELLEKELEALNTRHELALIKEEMLSRIERTLVEAKAEIEAA